MMKVTKLLIIFGLLFAVSKAYSKFDPGTTGVLNPGPRFSIEDGVDITNEEIMMKEINDVPRMPSEHELDIPAQGLLEQERDNFQHEIPMDMQFKQNLQDEIGTGTEDILKGINEVYEKPSELKYEISVQGLSGQQGNGPQAEAFITNNIPSGSFQLKNENSTFNENTSGTFHLKEERDNNKLIPYEKQEQDPDGSSGESGGQPTEETPQGNGQKAQEPPQPPQESGFEWKKEEDDTWVLYYNGKSTGVVWNEKYNYEWNFDENGNGTLTARNENNTITYEFSNGKVTKVNDVEVKVPDGTKFEIDDEGNSKISYEGAYAIINSEGKIIEANGVEIKDEEKLGNKLIIENDGKVKIQAHSVKTFDLIEISKDGKQVTLFGHFTFENENGSAFESITITQSGNNKEITEISINEVKVTYNSNSDVYSISAFGRRIEIGKDTRTKKHVKVNIIINENSVKIEPEQVIGGDKLSLIINRDDKVKVNIDNFSFEVPEGKDIVFHDNGIVFGEGDNKIFVGWLPNENGKFVFGLAFSKDGGSNWIPIYTQEDKNLSGEIKFEDESFIFKYEKEGINPIEITFKDGNISIKIGEKEISIEGDILSITINSDGSVKINYKNNEGSTVLETFNNEGEKSSEETTPEATNRPDYPRSAGCIGRELSDAEKQEIDKAWDTFYSLFSQHENPRDALNDPNVIQAFYKYLLTIQNSGGRPINLIYQWMLEQFNQIAQNNRLQAEIWWNRHQYFINVFLNKYATEQGTPLRIPGRIPDPPGGYSEQFYQWAGQNYGS